MWRRVPPYAALACWGEGALLASAAAAGEGAGGAYAVAHDLGEAEVARLEPLLDAAGGRSAAEGGGAGGGGAGGGGEGGEGGGSSMHGLCGLHMTSPSAQVYVSPHTPPLPSGTH